MGECHVQLEYNYFSSSKVKPMSIKSLGVSRQPGLDYYRSHVVGHQTIFINDVVTSLKTLGILTWDILIINRLSIRVT